MIDQKRQDIVGYEPTVTPSILASVPDCLFKILASSLEENRNTALPLLLSSNTLANRFILERWGIRPSQRKRYRNLFVTVRKRCRDLFRQYITRGRLEWRSGPNIVTFGVFKFDEVRGNVILGFVHILPGEEWKLRRYCEG